MLAFRTCTQCRSTFETEVGEPYVQCEQCRELLALFSPSEEPQPPVSMDEVLRAAAKKHIKAGLLIDSDAFETKRPRLSPQKPDRQKKFKGLSVLSSDGSSEVAELDEETLALLDGLQLI